MEHILLHHPNQLLIQVLFVFGRIVLVEHFSIEFSFVTWFRAHEMNIPRCWIRFLFSFLLFWLISLVNIMNSTFCDGSIAMRKTMFCHFLCMFFFLFISPSWYKYMERKPLYSSVFTFWEKQSWEEQNESKKIQHFYGFHSLNRIVWIHFVENRVKKY